MDPALIGTRLATSAAGLLIKGLLVQDGPGAGLTGTARRIRLSRRVSFRGAQRTLTDKDVRRLAATLVDQARTGPGEAPFPADEAEAVTDTLATTLLALGDLDMDDVQAVHLGATALAGRLRAAAPPPDGLSTDSVHFLDGLTRWACVHILEFFTERPTFVARTLVEQTRGQEELNAKVDEVIRRTPRADGRDTAFEERYLEHLAKKHSRLTIYGVDLHHSPDQWPLDMAYLSLEATAPATAGPWFSVTEAADAWREGNGTAALTIAAEDLLPYLSGTGHRPAETLHADLALARHDKVLLRGLAGSGKTTLVQWLTVSAAAGHRAGGMEYLRDRVPFVLPLRTLTRHGERLPAPDRFLPAAGCPLTPPDGWADRVLAAGRGLILVDGIDEVPEAERERARGWLRDLLAAYEGNRWLVTSRPTAVRDDWLASDGFTELTLSPMSRTEVTTFVRRWHQAAGPEAQPYEDSLLDALRTADHVAQLATNPLMCGLICALHRDRRGFLPRGRRALYEAALSMLLARRDRERDMGAPYGIELGEAPQIQLIQRLAYWLTLNGRTQMDRSRAESLVRERVPYVPEAAAFDDPDAVFTHLLHRSGLLREPTPDSVDFVHRTFQDHLAAKALVDRWDIGVLVRHAADDQWEDVVRMAVGHARPRECEEILTELLKAADAATDRNVQLRILVVAATALEEATEVSPRIRERILARTAEVIPPRDGAEARELASVGRAVLDLLPGPEGLDEESALMAVVTATHVAHDAALPYLRRFTRHPKVRVRSQLMWGWARYDTETYGEEIIARLDPDGLDYTIRSDAQAAELIRLGLRPASVDLRSGLSDYGLAALGPLLGEVENLALGTDMNWVLDSLPGGSRLRSLYLDTRPEQGLACLSGLPPLVRLTLGPVMESTAEDWGHIRALGSLRTLVLEGAALTSCPDAARIPQVRSLSLLLDRAGPTGPSGCLAEQIARAFPGLRKLHLLGTAPHGPAHDLAPLAGLRDLEYVITSGVATVGAEHLPSTVRLLT
ncbi:NACHT domain-containing protein [Streptomyces sp. NPDC054861]